MDCETIAGAQPVRLFGMRLQSQNANVEGLQPSKVMGRYADMMKLFESEHACFSQSIRLIFCLRPKAEASVLTLAAQLADLPHRRPRQHSCKTRGNIDRHRDVPRRSPSLGIEECSIRNREHVTGGT